MDDEELYDEPNTHLSFALPDDDEDDEDKDMFDPSEEEGEDSL